MNTFQITTSDTRNSQELFRVDKTLQSFARRKLISMNAGHSFLLAWCYMSCYFFTTRNNVVSFFHLTVLFCQSAKLQNGNLWCFSIANNQGFSIILTKIHTVTKETEYINYWISTLTTITKELQLNVEN